MIKKIIKIINNFIFRKNEIEILKERGLKLGKNVDIFSEYPFDSIYPGLIKIGDNVTISSNVKILAHDASMGYVTNGACKIGVVEIGSNVFIGYGAIILCNVRIGDNSVIGAGSVVTSDVPPNCVFAGNPAKFQKSIEDFRNGHIKNMHDDLKHHVFKISWKEFKKLKQNDWDDIRKNVNVNYGYIVREKI